MDPRKQSPAKDDGGHSDSEEEHARPHPPTSTSGVDDRVDDDEHADPDADAVAARAGDEEGAVYGRMGADEEARAVYRSTAIASPALGLGIMGGHALMHGGGLPGMSGMSGLPTPLSFAVGASKTPAAGATMGVSAKKSDSSSSSGAQPAMGVRVDRTNYIAVTPRDLPPPPFRLELHTHFHVKGEAIQRVCSLIGRRLCEVDSDFVFKTDKCKWKVDYRLLTGVQRVHFNILLFKTGKEYVVEVQRRQGDITALMQFYGELRALFKRNQLLSAKDKSTTTTTTSGGMKRPASQVLQQQPKASLSPASLQSAVSAIRGLLTSKFADVQMQGVLGAISLSTGDVSCSGMASLVPQLVQLSQSTHAQVALLVRVALSRLCDHPECRQAFIGSPGWEFVVQCAAGGADVHPEVQRESLHVVECLCPLYSDELAKVAAAGKVLALIQDWPNIEDPRLKKHACNAHRALKEAGAIA